MYRIRTEFTGLTGAPYLSTMYFGEVGSTPAGAHAAVAAFWASLKPAIVTSLAWTVLGEVDEVNESDGAIIGSVTVTSVSDNGSGGAESIPFASQGLLRWDTGQILAGKRIRGKTFLPGISEGANELGRPSASAITDLEFGATALLSAPSANLVVWSRKNGVSFPVSGVTMWNQWAVLRSRRD